jgi:hypothetical protein
MRVRIQNVLFASAALLAVFVCSIERSVAVRATLPASSGASVPMKLVAVIGIRC